VLFNEVLEYERVLAFSLSHSLIFFCLKFELQFANECSHMTNLLVDVVTLVLALF
jgi:hypothetical protein